MAYQFFIIFIVKMQNSHGFIVYFKNVNEYEGRMTIFYIFT